MSAKSGLATDEGSPRLPVFVGPRDEREDDGGREGAEAVRYPIAAATRFWNQPTPASCRGDRTP